MKSNKRLLYVIITLILIIIIVFAGIVFLGNYHFDRICQEEFRNRQFSILSNIDSLKNQTGLEFARTLSITHTTYEANVKTPEELLGVFCNVRVLLCKKESGEIRYCQEYEVPFTALVD